MIAGREAYRPRAAEFRAGGTLASNLHRAVHPDRPESP